MIQRGSRTSKSSTIQTANSLLDISAEAKGKFIQDKENKLAEIERKKRKELSISATKFLNKNDVTILVKFN